MQEQTFFQATQEFIKHWTNQLLVAFVILLIGIIIARMFKNVGYRVLHKLNINENIKLTTGLTIRLEEYLSKGIGYLVDIITVIIVLNELKATIQFLYVLLGIILIFVGVSLSLAFKDLIPNALGGIHLSKQKLLKEKQKVKIGKVKGVITKINLVEVYIETKEGDIIVIPNRTVIKEKITLLQAN